LSRQFQQVVQIRKRRGLYRCGRKVGYPTAANASSDLQLLAERKGGSGRLEVYHCAVCKGFHVGRAPQERKN
jgi:hypothetical protein